MAGGYRMTKQARVRKRIFLGGKNERSIT